MMTQVTEVEAATGSQIDTTVKDRRRPGRADSVSPELIPILRNIDPAFTADLEEADQTAALRGLCAGVLLSAPIWALIAYIGSRFLS